MKHLQHTYETPETLENIRSKHACYATFKYTLQHPDPDEALEIYDLNN
jgi:hypothetical protein